MDTIAVQGSQARSALRPGLIATVLGAAALLSGCLATTPGSGGQSATGITGAAGGAATDGANAALASCTETLGTVRIEENTNASWYSVYSSRYNTGSTVPALRLLIQQSNCFVIVERGNSLNSMNQERAIMRSDEGRAGSNFGGGQMVGADYTMSPSIMLSDRGGTQASSALSSFGGMIGQVSRLAGSLSTNEAATTLLLIDNRSGVQIAASEGYAKNVDFGAAGAIFDSGTAASAGAFTRTPQGKVIMAAFIDSYNKMVGALKVYKAQTVKGGLGTGGRLGVQGGQTDAGREAGGRGR